MTTLYSCCCLKCWKTWTTDKKPGRCPKCRGDKLDVQTEKTWED